MSEDPASTALRRRPLAVLAGALLWSLACCLILLLSLWQAEKLQSFHRDELLLVFAIGSLLGWLATELADLALSQRLSFRWRWPLMTVFLVGATLAFTAFLFALDYRAFYARWHASAFSINWTLQFLFTSASATYQFLVIGLRLYLPWAPLAAIAAAYLLVRRQR